MVQTLKPITQAGLDKLQAEFDRRVSIVRNEIAAEIELARSYGDLSENAEYTEAKKKQAENETEIARLQDAIANSRVVSDDEIDTDRVYFGATVVLENCATGDKLTYSIVGSEEADPFKGKISNESPVGAGLLGAAVGQTVKIDVPAGSMTFKVLEIKE